MEASKPQTNYRCRLLRLIGFPFGTQLHTINISGFHGLLSFTVRLLSSFKRARKTILCQRLEFLQELVFYALLSCRGT